MKSVDDRITESMSRWYGHMVRISNSRTVKVFVSVLVLEVLGDLKKHWIYVDK